MSSTLQRAEPTHPQAADRRWIGLAFIALAQLMTALDATIVRIALPWAQRALGASDAERQWVITAYTLAFGGLLLVGGRIADTIGRRRAFLIGLGGFAVASVVGGSAQSFIVLLIARAAQGAFAALLAPTALSLLAVTFTQPRERARAFALYGAIAGSGAALGLLLGGALTEYLDWRWCLYVNVPIALVAAIGGWQVLSSGNGGHRQRFDFPGVVLATGGLVALVYGCTQAVSAGWGSGTVIGLLAASAALLIGFAVREARAAAPLLPLRVVLDRSRGRDRRGRNAGRRVARDGGAEHDRGECDRRLPRQRPETLIWPDRAGAGSWLLDGDQLGRRHPGGSRAADRPADQRGPAGRISCAVMVSQARSPSGSVRRILKRLRPD